MAKTLGKLVLGTTLCWWLAAPVFGQLPAAEPADPDAAESLPGIDIPPRPTPADEPMPADGLDTPLDLERLKLKDPEDAEFELEPVPTQYEMWDFMPALTESSGTWLRRGFWYTEVDAVVFNRFWNRDRLIYAVDSASEVFPGPQDTGRVLLLDGDRPGAEASARFTLGRFLFRDMCNRDHSVEFTAFGGGEFVQDCNITSRFPGAQRLNVPGVVDLNNLSFDGAVSMDIDYTSRFNSFETNYLVRDRMTRDRMLMDPCGEWVRQASPSLIREYLIGLRYFDLTEAVRWNAFDFSGAPGSSGFYNIDTDNDLFGFQMGTAFRYEQGRWSVGLTGKAGVFLNDVESETEFARTDMPTGDFTTESKETVFSFIGQSGVMFKWHLRPNLSLRAGYELMYVTSTALAPHQINFRPDDNKVVYSGDPFYHGAAFGFEGYW